MALFTIRPLSPADRDQVRKMIVESWGAEIVVAHRTVYEPSELPGLVGVMGGELAGILTYVITNNQCEIVTLNSWREGFGIGSALIDEMIRIARKSGCAKLWLSTTNDNTHALRFYQKRGFSISAIHINAIEYSRSLKPEIPKKGQDGIPIRDEIELEMNLK